jgi:peroxiredoxin
MVEHLVEGRLLNRLIMSPLPADLLGYFLDWFSVGNWIWRYAVARSDNIYELPPDLPIPLEDGAADHLLGSRLPSLQLAATDGQPVDLASMAGWTVVYCYPRTGRPDQETPIGWNQIPGARGCTPQSRAFRDHFTEVQRLGARLFGLSTQDSDYQREAVERLHLPFPLLSDAQLDFARALRLPTFEVDGMVLIKRLTLIARDGLIEKVFYPVFPPDRNAEDVVAWLANRSASA